MPKCNKNIFFLLPFICIWSAAPAQFDKLRFEKVIASQELPNCNIEQAVEDQYGFLWFASCEGLFRYDGHGFKAYRHDLMDSTSLSNPYIRCIYNDKGGNIWLGTPNGLDLLDRRTGKFQRFKPQPEDTETKVNNQVRKIIEDGKGNLLVSSGRGLLSFDPEEKRFTLLAPQDKPASTHLIRSFLKDRHGIIWAGTNNGLLQLNTESNSYQHVLPDPNPESLYNNNIECFLEGPDGSFLLGTRGGLINWSPVSKTIRKTFLPDEYASLPVDHAIKDGRGNIWIAFTNNGLGVFNVQEQQFHTYVFEADQINGLINDKILYIMEDHFQNIWVCTAIGICKIKTTDSGFQVLQNVASNNNTANYCVRVLEDTNGRIWSKTPEGLYKIEAGAPSGTLVELAGKTKNLALGSWFMEDAKGGVWTSIDEQGIYYLRAGEQNFAKLQLGDTLEKAVVYKMLKDPADPSIVWIGTSEGLCRMDLNSYHRKWYIPNTDIPAVVSNKVSIFEQYGKDEIWMYYTYYNSLGRFDKKSGTFEQFRPSTEKQKLLEGSVKDIAIGKDGNVWIATLFGLTNFNINTKTFQIFTKRDGLQESELNTVILDQKDQLWICGHRFMARFDMAQKYFQNYQISKEVKNFISKSKFINPDGRVFLGSFNGMLTFHPDSIHRNQERPKVVLTDFKVKDETYLLKEAFENTTEIILSHDENDLTFEFSGLHFINPEGNKYRCKLEGYNEKWQQLGKEHRAVYANLDHGNYVFRAIAANSDGVWNEQGLAINLIITPAYWETMWFKALILLVLLSIGYAIFKNRQHQLALRRQKEIAEQSAEYKTRFLADVSHEIRTPMNAIIGLSKLALDTPLDKKQAKFVGAIQQSSQNLLTIINDLLDHTKLEAGKFTFVKKPFDLKESITQLEDTLRHKAEEKQLKLEINIDPDLPSKLLGDPIRLNQILTNLLGNAIKFTEQGRIWLHVKKAGDDPEYSAELIFEIGDTGSGIPKDKIKTIFENFGQAENGMQVEGTGLGLPIARQLVEKQGGQLGIKSEPGKGTTLWFNLKFEKQEAENGILATQKPIYNFRPLKILVVEDTYFNQMLVVEILKKEIKGVEIELAENGRLAMDKLAGQPFDIILMDVKMPVMDGYEACRLIRKSEEPSIKNIPILGVTASATDAQLQKCKAAGMDDCITKPIDSDELLSKIFLLTTKLSDAR